MLHITLCFHFHISWHLKVWVLKNKNISVVQLSAPALCETSTEHLLEETMNKMKGSSCSGGQDHGITELLTGLNVALLHYILLWLLQKITPCLKRCSTCSPWSVTRAAPPARGTCFREQDMCPQPLTYSHRQSVDTAGTPWAGSLEGRTGGRKMPKYVSLSEAGNTGALSFSLFHWKA